MQRPTTTETASSLDIFDLNANASAKWIRKSTFAAYVCIQAPSGCDGRPVMTHVGFSLEGV